MDRSPGCGGSTHVAGDAIAMRADGVDDLTVRRARFALEIHGCCTMAEPSTNPTTARSRCRGLLSEYGLDLNAVLTPLDVIRPVKPTILGGATAARAPHKPGAPRRRGHLSHQAELRRVSLEIACAVVRYASDHDLGRCIDPEDVETTVRPAMWDPAHVRVRHPEDART
jgi:hypothetical protein